MFTRTEAVKLTGLTRGQIQKLCEENIIRGKKFGGMSNSPRLYSFSQIVEMRAIKALKDQSLSRPPRKRIRYSEIVEALKTLVEMGHDRSLVSKKGYIIAYSIEDGGFILIKPQEAMTTLITGKKKYQLGIYVDQMIEDVETLAKKNNVLDFEERRGELETVATAC